MRTKSRRSVLTRSLASAVALLTVGCALPSETNDVEGGNTR